MWDWIAILIGVAMRAVKAIYQDGKFELSEPVPEKDPVDVLVIFPGKAADPW